MCDQIKLEEIILKIVEAAKAILDHKLDRIILYGSYARGDYTEESDIDIIVIANIPADESWKTRMKISKLTGWLDLEYDVLVSLHVTDCATFYKFANVLPFYINVLNEGVELIA